MSALLHASDGTRASKASLATTTSTETFVTINEDLYEKSHYNENDASPAGNKVTLFCRAGYKMTQADFDALFPLATITGLSPTNLALAGGDVVTITGTNLDGTSSVDFNGIAGTNLVVVSATELQVTAPSQAAAGTYDVVVHDDAGDVTDAGAVTYA